LGIDLATVKPSGALGAISIADVELAGAATWLEKRNAAVPIGARALFAAVELKAVALALRETPELNGFCEGGAFRPGPGMHLGVAISLRGGGLVTPALHDVDKLSLTDLMAQLKDLLRRARSGQLRSSAPTGRCADRSTSIPSISSPSSRICTRRSAWTFRSPTTAR
jgi:pyruvate/2-oxoglutarate dehydrogenase complex dihydrolipoamide acyltransferase (E2) component